MKNISKLLLLVVLVAALALVGCGPKKPEKELVDAEAALKAANDSGADVYQTDEYLRAKQNLEAAKQKMALAEQSGDKELYKQAREELLKAIEDFEIAKQNAEKCNELNKKLDADLADLDAQIEGLKADALYYNSPSYEMAVQKRDEARVMRNKCDQEKGLALAQESKDLLGMVPQEIADKKAEIEAKLAAQNADDSAEIEMYTVVKGDSLWKISDAKYANPFMWPLIYMANKADIKDPDLIFPGQEFKITKSFSDAEKADAINTAKTRGPWSLFDGK